VSSRPEMDRERKILMLRASGLENEQIARRLLRSVSIISTEATRGIEKIRDHPAISTLGRKCNPPARQ
jgi:DNA-binding NarL/FixJ family response regulator